MDNQEPGRALACSDASGAASRVLALHAATGVGTGTKEKPRGIRAGKSACHSFPFGRILLAGMLLAAFAVVAGCSCEEEGVATDENGDEPDEEQQESDPFAEELIGKLERLSTGGPGEREAAREWIREHGEEAAPHLVRWLADDPGLGMPVRHMLLEEERGEGWFAAYEWAQALDMRESLDLLVDHALKPERDLDVKERARKVVAAGGEAALEAAHDYMLEDPRRAREISGLMREFPRDQALLFWMLRLADEEPITRESARRWVDFLFEQHDRVSAELVFEAIPDLPEEIEVDEREDERGVFYPREHLLMKIKGAIRLSPGDDPWLIEAMGRCLHRMERFPSRTLARMAEIIHEQRRLGALHRLERWVEENEPERGEPGWAGHQHLRGIMKQVRVELERWDPEVLRDDVVIEPSVGTEVPYGPEETSEYVRSPVTGERFRASQLSYDPEPARWPGLFGGEDDELRERLRAILGEETWRRAWPSEAFGQPPRGIEASLRDRIDEWPLEVRNYFAYSPVMQALSLLDEELLAEPLAELLEAQPENWRVFAGATMVLARIGRLPDPLTLELYDPRVELGTLEAKERALDTARNWQALALATALSFDPEALGRDRGAEALRADTLVSWLEDISPWLATSTRLQVVNPRYVEARLASAWAWALTRQQALIRPHVWDVPLERWLKPMAEHDGSGSAGGTTWGQLAVLHAWMRLADEHEPLRDIAAIRLLGAEAAHVRSALAQLNWDRHPWILGLIGEELERDPSAAQPVWVDVLRTFEFEAHSEHFAVLLQHDDPAIREAAVEALPAEQPWLDPLRKALADPEEAVVLAAAAQLLAGPEEDSRDAESLLTKRDRGRLIEHVGALPAERGTAILVPALEEREWMSPAIRAARRLPEALAERDASAQTRKEYALSLVPFVRDPNWATPDDRRSLLLAAATLSQEGSAQILREAVLEDPVQRVREAALDSLLEVAGAEKVPLLLEVLEGTDEVYTQVQILQFFARNEPLVAEPGVVDALLPYLERKDADGLWAEAQLALITRELGPVDERIIPAFARAYKRGVMQPLTVQPLRFMLAHPSPETIDVFIGVLTDPEQRSGEIQFVQRYLTRNYYRLPEIRDKLREVWPRLMYRQRVLVAEIVARPYEPEVLDASWIDTFIGTEWETVEGLPAQYDEQQMPDEIAVAIAFLAGMELPKQVPEALGRLRAEFPRLSDWRSWWRERREHWMRRAEEDYQRNVAKAQEREEAGDFQPPRRNR